MEKTVDIGHIMNEIFSNAYVTSLCIRKQNMNWDEKEKIEDNFSRAVGYGILFKSSDGIEEYMKIKDEKDQIEFLKNKIAHIKGIPEQQIENNNEIIKDFIVQNFKVNGYVFHAGSSYTIQNELINGLDGEGTSNEYKNEMLKIDNIYKKYTNLNPLGWGIIDINNERNRLVL